MLELSEISRIGFGSYRISVNNNEHSKALSSAINMGCNLIDTASNYSNGESEQLVGKVILENADKNLFLVTKAGYIQGNDLIKAKNFLNSYSSIKISDSFYYSLNIDFINFQLENSLNRLNRQYIDAFLIHNPEHYFSVKEFLENKEKVYSIISDAFSFLEEKVKEGKIRYYGISSNTLPFSISKLDTLNIEILFNLANAITPNHHFKVIQFPFNIKEQDALLTQHSDGKSLIQLSNELNLLTISNRPLNCKIPSGALRLAIYQNLEALDEIGDNLLFEDFFESVLLKLKEHNMENQWEEFPILTHLKKSWKNIGNPEAVVKIFNEHLLPFLNSLYDENIPSKESSIFYLLFDKAIQYSKQYMNTEALKVEADLISNGIISHNQSSLPFRVCKHYLDQGIQHVLVGMRNPNYVNEFQYLFKSKF